MAETRRRTTRRTTEAGPSATTGAATRGGAPACSVALCPICAVVTAVGDAQPEIMAHLLLAGREMLLALRSIIDARLDTMEGQSSGLERITIE